MAKKKVKTPELIEVKTEAKYLPVSTRKMRLIAAAIKKMDPKEALRKLSFLNKKGAKFFIKAIKTAIADAENNFGLDDQGLSFKEILVNEGSKSLKRRDKSHGARFNSGVIQRPKSHLIIKLVGEKK